MNDTPAWKLQQSDFEKAANEHSLMQKKKKLQQQGAPQAEIAQTKLEGVDPSKAASLSPSLNKTVAAAQLAQSVGAVPSEGGAGGAISGAITGAQVGGVPGAVIGGIAGAVMGSASARAAKKAHNRQVEAQKHQQLGQIAQAEGQNIANVLSGMGARMKIY